MPISPSPENVLLGKGKLLLDRFDSSGVAQGFFHLGNCETFEISTEDDVVENQNFMIAAGGVYKSVTRARTVNINISGFEFSTQSLALALMGDPVSSSQTTGTATETLSTNVTEGRFYRTAGRQITITQLTSGTNTLTATTDYTVYDFEAGVIQIVEGAPNVTNGDDLVAIYTQAGITTLEVIRGAKASKVEGTLIYLPDPATGPKWEITAWIVSFNPDGSTGFIGDDFGTWSVVGKVLDDSTGAHGGSANEPYYKAVKVA